MPGGLPDNGNMRGKDRVAVIDVGSNTIKVLCVEGCEGRLQKLGAESVEARLGGEHRGDRPWLTDERRRAAVQAIQDLLEFSKIHSVDKVELVATSAVRDAENNGVFHAEVERAVGLSLRILSESQEALFIGRGIACDPGVPDGNSFRAVDLGGGSMECILYQDGSVEQGVSLPLGAVRLTRALDSNGQRPMTDEEVARVQAIVLNELSEISPALGGTGPIVGCGGAFSASRAILADRAGLTYEAMQARMSTADLAGLFEELRALPVEERSRIPHLPAGRADILPVALLVLLTVAEDSGVREYHHSHYNLRFGLAATLLGHFVDEG